MKTSASTVEELREALAAVETDDVVIEIDGEIACGGEPLATPRSDHAVEIVGISDRAGLYLQAVWDGQARESGAGLCLQNAFAHVHGLAFSGWEREGAALCPNGARTIITRCRFADIGTLITRPKRMPVKTAADTYYCHAIGGASPDVTIDGCEFSDSAWSTQWSWCIYLWGGGPLARVSGCRFDRIGNGIAAGRERVILDGNACGSTHWIWRADTEQLGWPLFVQWSQSRASFIGNRLAGRFGCMFYCSPEQAIYAEGNDYSGANVPVAADPPSCWWVAGGAEPHQDWASWRARHDRLSSPPADAGVM